MRYCGTDQDEVEYTELTIPWFVAVKIAPKTMRLVDLAEADTAVVGKEVVAVVADWRLIDNPAGSWDEAAYPVYILLERAVVISGIGEDRMIVVVASIVHCILVVAEEVSEIHTMNQAVYAKKAV